MEPTNNSAPEAKDSGAVDGSQHSAPNTPRAPQWQGNFGYQLQGNTYRGATYHLPTDTSHPGPFAAPFVQEPPTAFNAVQPFSSTATYAPSVPVPPVRSPPVVPAESAYPWPSSHCGTFWHYSAGVQARPIHMFAPQTANVHLGQQPPAGWVPVPSSNRTEGGPQVPSPSPASTFQFLQPDETQAHDHQEDRAQHKTPRASHVPLRSGVGLERHGHLHERMAGVVLAQGPRPSGAQPQQPSSSNPQGASTRWQWSASTEAQAKKTEPKLPASTHHLGQREVENTNPPNPYGASSAAAPGRWPLSASNAPVAQPQHGQNSIQRVRLGENTDPPLRNTAAAAKAEELTNSRRSSQAAFRAELQQDHEYFSQRGTAVPFPELGIPPSSNDWASSARLPERQRTTLLPSNSFTESNAHAIERELPANRAVVTSAWDNSSSYSGGFEQLYAPGEWVQVTTSGGHAQRHNVPDSPAERYRPWILGYPPSAEPGPRASTYEMGNVYIHSVSGHRFTPASQNAEVTGHVSGKARPCFCTWYEANTIYLAPLLGAIPPQTTAASPTQTNLHVLHRSIWRDRWCPVVWVPDRRRVGHGYSRTEIIAPPPPEHPNERPALRPRIRIAWKDSPEEHPLKSSFIWAGDPGDPVNVEQPHDIEDFRQYCNLEHLELLKLHDWWKYMYAADRMAVAPMAQ